MILDAYLRICRQRGGREEVCTELGIKKLVMGGATDRHYSRKMMDLKSRKAIFVRREAPALCQIWFTCKGYLIHTREDADDSESEYAFPRPSVSESDLLQTFSTPESEHQHISREQSLDSIYERRFFEPGSSKMGSEDVHGL